MTKCEDCRGTGAYMELLVREKCEKCEGYGEVRKEKININDYFDPPEDEFDDDYYEYLIDQYEEAGDSRYNYIDPFGD